MKEIDVNNWERNKTYNWFKGFSNSTYSCNVVMDVTELVNYSKKTKTSFFINMLYLVVKGLNSVEEMRMRIVDDKVILFDDINPAYTVMTKVGSFDNVRHKNYDNYSDFYATAEEVIQKAKNQIEIKDDEYNPANCWDEYYITCLPWINFTQFTHPIPDDICSQCVPRICWGKYFESDGGYKINLNITVSHVFVDGYPLSKAFLNIQNLIDNSNKELKFQN